LVTYLDILNRARARQGGNPLSATTAGGNTGDALIGIQAVNEAVAEFYNNTFDLDQEDKVIDVTTVINQSLLDPPTGSDNWDSNVISCVSLLRTANNDLLDLALITLKEAEQRKLIPFTNNEPRFWYVNQGNIFILPEPKSAFTIKVFYQGIVPDITSSNITNTVILPTAGIDALVSLTYSYLRRGLSDPEWSSHQAKAMLKLDRFFQRNKHTYKRKGFMHMRMNYNYADRTL